MDKKYKLKYPISIYIIVFLYSVLAIFFIYDAIISFELEYPIIEYLLAVLLLVFIRKNAIFYNTKGSVTIHLGFAYPIVLIFGLVPVILAYFVLLFLPNNKFENKVFFRRYFNYCNYIVSTAISYNFFEYLSGNYFDSDYIFILFIILGALIIFLINGLIVPLMFYLEKGEKINKNINFNVFESNAMNGIITYYLYQVLGMAGIFIAVAYAVIFSKRSLYQAKYHKITGELKETEQRLRLVFDTIDYGIIMLDMDKRIKMANPIAIKFLESFSPKPVGKKISDFSNVFLIEISELIEWTYINKVNFQEKKVPFKIGDNIFYYDIYIYPSKIDSGEKMDGVILLYRNITDEQLFRRQLIEADKLSHLGQIAAGKVHEIRNPLTTVRGYLQFLKKRLSGGQTININNFDIALQELDRTNEIIGSLLILSMDSYHEPEVIEINLILTEIINLFQHQITEKNINFNAELENGLYIMGVKNHLKQIFINLFLNAVDALTLKGFSARNNRIIELKAYSNAEDVVIEISDNGIGISEENIKKLYDHFFTTKETGTGLGLSVTHKLVKELDGNIEVESKLNEGTKFIVSFPKTG